MENVPSIQTQGHDPLRPPGYPSWAAYIIHHVEEAGYSVMTMVLDNDIWIDNTRTRWFMIFLHADLGGLRELQRMRLRIQAVSRKMQS